MAACPFCKAEVTPELLRFGGNCPACMIEIPGEEAPTDPGERAKVMQELEEQAARSKSRLPMVAAAAVFGIAIGGAAVWAILAPEPPEQALAFDEDELYIVPLTAHQDLRNEEQQAAVAAVSKGTSKGSSKRGSTSKPRNGKTARSVALEQPATGGTVADPEQPVAEGSVVPRAGGGLENPLASLGPSVKRADIESMVLKDPAQINAMVKRVMTKGGGQLKQCYESRLKENEKLRGAWKVQFQIGESHAQDVSVSPMDNEDPGLEGCMTRNIQSWRFIRVSEPLVVQKVYRFGPGW